MKTKLVKCTCAHVFQDKTYGPQIRVANKLPVKPNTVKPNTVEARCTVCGRVHTVGAE